MLILNSEIYISLFLLIQVISFQEKPPWNAPAWTRTYIYMNVKQEDIETQNIREKLLTEQGAKTQKKKLLIALVFF